MEEMNSLKFYKSFFEAINDLDDEDRLQLYDAIMRYQFLKIEPIFNNKYLNAIWKTIVPNIDSYNKSASEGRKGGAPVGNSNAKKKTTEKQPKNDSKTTKTTPLVLKNNPPCENKTTEVEEEVEEEEEVEVEVEDEVEVDTDAEKNKDPAVAEKKIDRVYDYYEKNIDVLTERTQEVIEPYRQSMPDDLVIFAMQLAVDNKARRLSYVDGVLKSWQKSGIKTLLQAKEEQENFRYKKAKPVSKANAPNDLKYHDVTGQYSELEDFYES